MNRLTPANNRRNLWFRDYWEDMFDCNVVGGHGGVGGAFGDGVGGGDPGTMWLGGPGGGRSRSGHHVGGIGRAGGNKHTVSLRTSPHSFKITQK